MGMGEEEGVLPNVVTFPFDFHFLINYFAFTT